MPDWLDVALEEYRALRAEIVATLETQYATLTFGTAAVGLLVGFGFNAWDEAFVAQIAFLGAVPAVAYLVLVIWMGELTRMMRAGDYLAELECRINEEVRAVDRPDALGWETFLRKEAEEGKTAQHRWHYRAIIGMYQLLAIASIAVGMHRLGLSASGKTVLILLAEAVAFIFVASFLYWQWCARLRVRGRVYKAFRWICGRIGVPFPETSSDRRRAEST